MHDKTISKTFISVLKEFQEYLTRTQASLSANPTSNIFNLYYEVCSLLNSLYLCLETAGFRCYLGGKLFGIF